MTEHEVVSREQWLEARKALLEKEKAHTRAREALAEERRTLPWVKVEKAYAFETPKGRRSLGELFGSKGQLLVYHFMFGPDWKAGCSSCSFWADNFAGAIPHLGQRDVAMVVVSRAPLAKIEEFRARMGWDFLWASSHESDFNRDYGVTIAPEERETVPYNYGTKGFPSTEAPGLSVFAREGADVFHTYSVYARGIDGFNGTYQLLDLAPKGRDEKGLKHAQEWIKHRDRYEER